MPIDSIFHIVYNSGMIDAIDHKIILALRENGRISNVNLSRELRLSVSTIGKRVEKLLSEQIITIKAVINPFRMGYKANAFIVLDVDLTKVESVCGELINNPNISYLATSFGRFDVTMIVDFTTWETLNNFVRTDLSQIEGVNKVDAFFISEIKKRYQGIFDNTDYLAPIAIDEINRKLIEELGKNGLNNYAELADKLGIGLATVSRRIASLIKENIIKIIAVPNPSKLGRIANANIALNVDLKKVNSICDELVSQRPVYMVMTMMNGFEILVGVDFSNPEMLYKLITQKIARMDGVHNVETFIRAEILKANYARLEFDEM